MTKRKEPAMMYRRRGPLSAMMRMKMRTITCRFEKKERKESAMLKSRKGPLSAMMKRTTCHDEKLGEKPNLP
jgi:hypothetical protein